jgi:hypothetical protein
MRHEDGRLNRCTDSRKLAFGRQVDRIKRLAIQFILISALQRKTGVPRSGEAPNFAAIYQFRSGLSGGMMG